MAKKRNLKDYALDIVRELVFGPTEDEAPAPVEGATLEDIKLDDLRREKVRLEQEERKMLARLRDVEGKKRQLFEEGVRNASEREQRVIARRIKELDVRASNMDRMLGAISKQMRIFNGLIEVKERERLFAESGTSKKIFDMDLQDLIVYVDKASVDGEFALNKFDDLLGVLEEADSLSPQYREDTEISDIMQAMQSAREAADSPEALDQKYEEFSRQMAEKDDEQEFDSFEEEL